MDKDLVKPSIRQGARKHQARRPLRRKCIRYGNPDATINAIRRYGLSVNCSNKWVRSATKSLILGIRNVLYVSGYCARSATREIRSIQHIITMAHDWSESQFVDAIKYLSAKVLPELDGEEAPERPEFLSPTATLFTGEWGRYVRPRLSVRKDGSYSSTGLKLALSILQIKRFIPALPTSEVARAAIKHREKLTKVSRTPTPMLNAIYRAVQELFPVGWDRRIKKPEYALSNKACFEATRSSGGRQGYMFDALKEDDGCTTCLCSDSLFSMVEVRKGVVVEVRSHAHARGKAETEEFARQTFNGKVCAGVKFVEDPMKVRPVTKDNWQLGVLKPLQKAIHGHLREFDQFQLIGGPVTDDLMNIFGGKKPEELYISGDYAAATDNLNHDASVNCLNWILDNCRSSWACEPITQIMARSSMRNVRIHCDPAVETEMRAKFGTTDFTQTSGQLMGSLLSFPILCVINYACWAEVVARCTGFYPKVSRGGGWDERNRVLINGDDIAFLATRKFYRKWWTAVTSVGLEPSIGKNYASKRFLMINSTAYTFGSEGAKRVPWVNLALLKPLVEKRESKYAHDILNAQDASPLESLGAMHDKFVSDCARPDRAASVFVHHHLDELKTTFRNLYGPVNLGGLGATPVEATKASTLDGYNFRQLTIARLCKDGFVSLPSYAQSPAFSDKVREFEKARFGELIDLWEGVEVPVGSEDVTELVGAVTGRFRTLLAWLSPLGLSGKTAMDLVWAKRIMNKYSRLEPMNYKDYIEAPRKLRKIASSKAMAEVFPVEPTLVDYLLD